MLAIVLELQRKKVLKAEELAESLGVNIRTIYRDIQVLSEAGVPIIGATGLGYSLMEGYFLPPVSFTVEEAVALLSGAEFVEQRFNTTYYKSARSSRRKIEAILSQPIRGEADKIRSNIRLLHKEKSELREREETNLATIQKAIREAKKLGFSYNKRVPGSDGKRETLRTVAPYGLVLDEQNGWLLVAACDLQEDIRHFKVSRINDLSIVDEVFQLPSDFNLQGYRLKDDRIIQVSVLFNREVADRVIEAKNYYMETAEYLENGYFVVFRVRHPEELLPWVLSWGGDAVVIEPDSFKNRVREEEIEKMMKRY